MIRNGVDTEKMFTTLDLVNICCTPSRPA